MTRLQLAALVENISMNIKR